MMLRLARATLLAGLISAATAVHAEPAPEAGPCRAVQAEGEAYTVCIVDLKRQRLRLFWLGSDGLPYSSLSNLAEKQGGRLSFAMNAGMYDKGQAPVGLYVEEGREMKGVSTANGPGNFHLKPNGIFYVKGDKAGVAETGRYLKAKIKPDFATQSGPMLVIEGQVHPKISADGPSQKIRNGVGVREDGRVAVFAISERPVSFGSFARLFRDDLGCRNALFLDGSVSSLYAPSLNRSDLSRPLGPMVGALSR
ncbi:prepilin-type processing-associated H-X9-DG protein [Methylobacterium sp. BE186]|uniref:phosphodiester glycosidase family protein n=1 Tax=Methylobacterium sp. BE186 TaxID=2817715 RepID=UPI002865AD49|nr:phosphodiester glycosidase family protein [Methylobacterium sp. BE186]MDR7037055.1 prepilin-type processing-associated H-X9-DG protein [Methylobacterium sp. BE186]